MKILVVKAQLPMPFKNRSTILPIASLGVMLGIDPLNASTISIKSIRIVSGEFKYISKSNRLKDKHLHITCFSLGSLESRWYVPFNNL